MTASAPEPLRRVAARVVLRRLAPADLRAFQAYRQDKELGRYQGWVPLPDTQARAFVDEMSRAVLFAPGAWVQLGIVDRQSDVLIGDIGLCVAAAAHSAEIGFTLRRQSQGSGLGTEAVAAAIELLFEQTAVAQVVGITDARNASSIGVLERVGMQRVSTERAVFRGEPCVEHRYRLARYPEMRD